MTLTAKEETGGGEKDFILKRFSMGRCRGKTYSLEEGGGDEDLSGGPHCPSLTRCMERVGRGRLGGNLCDKIKAMGSKVDCQCESPCWKSCASRCAKTLVTTTNLVFLTCGVSLIVVGFWIYIDTESRIYMDLLDNLPAVGPLLVVDRLPALLLVSGTCVSLLGFLGCCGACSDSVCFLGLYTILLLLLIIAQTVMGTVMFVFQDKMMSHIESDLQYQITYEYNKTAKLSNETSSHINHVTAAWDIVQIKLGCCGATGPKDYMLSAWFNVTKHSEGVFVPPSCCVLLNDDVTDPWVFNEDACQIGALLYQQKPIYRSSIKTQGCQWKFMRWLSARVLIIICGVTTALTLQILHLVFACVLLANVRRSHTEYLWYDEDCG